MVSDKSRQPGMRELMLTKILLIGQPQTKGWRQNKFTFMGVKMPVQQGERKANSELFN